MTRAILAAPSTIVCCAACLHPIDAPDRPLLLEGQFFHPTHLPVGA